jgi:hypothetical protein
VKSDGLIISVTNTSTWRPIKEIQTSPLAVCDYNTLHVSDLMETDLVSETYVGETYSITYNRNHRFYWMSNQKPYELCVFVTFDSDNSFPDAPLTSKVDPNLHLYDANV